MIPPGSAEVLVIGGGLIGSSVAYHLAARGAQVVLVEKNDVAMDTSGACDGMVFLQTKKPGIHLEIALESARRIHALAETAPRDIEYRNCGGMMVIEDQDDLRAMETFVRRQHESGLQVELIGPEEAIGREPLLSRRILGATFSSLDAQVHPYYLNYAYIAMAEALGATVVTHCEVTGIVCSMGKVQKVLTTGGEVRVQAVVNAAGIFAPAIGRMAGVEIPIRPRRGQVIVTEELAPVVSSIVVSANTVAVKYSSEGAGAGRGGVGIEQTRNGNLLLGATREYVGFDASTTFRGLRSISEHIVEIFPDLQGVRVIRTFAGLRPSTADGLPILGPVDGLGGFVMAAGHEGDGVSLSAITGEIIAGYLDDGKTDHDLEPFLLSRFGR